MNILVQLVINSLQIGAIYVLFSLGLTLVFGVMRVINFAHGELFALAAIIIAVTVERVAPGSAYWMRYTLSFFLAFSAVLLLAAILYFGGLSRFLGDLESGFIFSLGCVLILRGLMTHIFGAYPLAVQPLANSTIIILGGAVATQKVLVAAFALTATVVLLFLIYRTKLGAALRALAEDQEAAMLQGIRIKRLAFYGFLIGSSLAAIAGGLIAPLTVILPGMGAEFITKAFMIVIIGGLGSIWGAIIASFFLAFIESFGSFFIDLPLVTVLTFVLVAALLVVRPQGILGGRIVR
jgi:branched-chain amino acid transport system permease protein